jgi:hypothetical protein
MRLMVRNCSWQWMDVSLKCESSRIDGSLLQRWWFVCFGLTFFLPAKLSFRALFLSSRWVAPFGARLVRKILLEKKTLFLATPLSWKT